jgi:hypothetical protein
MMMIHILSDKLKSYGKTMELKLMSEDAEWIGNEKK